MLHKTENLYIFLFSLCIETYCVTVKINLKILFYRRQTYLELIINYNIFILIN